MSQDRPSGSELESEAVNDGASEASSVAPPLMPPVVLAPARPVSAPPRPRVSSKPPASAVTPAVQPPRETLPSNHPPVGNELSLPNLESSAVQQEQEEPPVPPPQLSPSPTPVAEEPIALRPVTGRDVPPKRQRTPSSPAIFAMQIIAVGSSSAEPGEERVVAEAVQPNAVDPFPGGEVEGGGWFTPLPPAAEEKLAQPDIEITVEPPIRPVLESIQELTEDDLAPLSLRLIQDEAPSSSVTTVTESSLDFQDQTPVPRADLAAAVAAEAPPPPPRRANPASEPSIAAEVAQPELAKKIHRHPWWEDLFDEDFQRANFHLTEEQVRHEVGFIERALGVAAGGIILDLGCGAGQHSVALASRGYGVVGYDLSLHQLALAAEVAQERNQKINFLQGDMREMAFDAVFDGVFCWNTTFGYFEEEKNISVAQRVFRALRPGGIFLLDVANRDFVAAHTPAQHWFEGDCCVCMDDANIDYITSRLRVKRSLVLDDGRTKECHYSLRLYALHELGKLLHDVGFRVIQASGDVGTPGLFFGPNSPRIIMVAQRP